MTNIEAARIIHNFVSHQLGLPPKHRDIAPVEELALCKAVKALIRLEQNKPKGVVDV